MTAGVAAQAVERRLHGETAGLGEDALGLFDDDAAVQRGLQLFGDDLAVTDGAFLQYPDGGDVGQRLAQAQVGLGERAGPDVEQVHPTDGLSAQA